MSSSALAGEPTASENGLSIRIDKLEKRVAKLEALLQKLTAPTEKVDDDAEALAAADSTLPLTLGRWSYRFVSGDFGNNFYAIQLELTNNSAKGIKLIDASVQFSDLLDESIYGLKVDPDLKIPPGKKIVDSGKYGINQFIPSQARMRSMNIEDIKCLLVVRRIVFDDNSVWTGQ